MNLSQTFVAAVSTNRQPAVLLKDHQFADLLNWGTSESNSILGGDHVTGYVHTLQRLHSSDLLDFDGDRIQSRLHLQILIQNTWHKIDLDTGDYETDVYNTFFFIPAHLMSEDQLISVFTLKRPFDMIEGEHSRSTTIHQTNSTTQAPSNQRQHWLL